MSECLTREPATYSFGLRRVLTLTARARRLTPRPRRGDEYVTPSWCLNPQDPEALLAGYPSLSLKPGWRLISYLYSDGLNAGSSLWAVPSDLFDAARALDLAHSGQEGPVPDRGNQCYMQAITGDGTPWSYLQASLFAREAQELGADWHGTDWAYYALLGSTPASTWGEVREGHEMLADALADSPEWTWKAARPDEKDWRPRVIVTPEAISVVFHTYTAYGMRSIDRWTDRYTPGSYDFETDMEHLATAEGGFIP